MVTPTPEQARELAGRLTKAQRRSVEFAEWHEADGAWRPEGWYASGDRRVRRALCLAKLAPDYIRHANRLTPLGLAVRAILQEQANG